MMEKSARRSPLVIVLALTSGLVASGTVLLGNVDADAAGSYPAQCASRDLQAWLRIEQHGEAGDVDGAVVGKAFLTLLEARHLCGQQQVAQALALYDSVLPAPVTAATK
jgi:hypothetical protein